MQKLKNELATISNQGIQVFENSDFGRVRTIVIDGKPWFVGKDVVEILGYRNGSRDINRHVEEEDRKYEMLPQYQNGTLVSKAIIINESGLYSLILRSLLPTAKKFKRWVTSEILPSIRKHGTYSNTGQVDFLIPKTYSEALRLAADLQEKNEVLESKVEQDKPKVEFANAVGVSKTSITVNVMAKLLAQNGVKIGVNRLYAWLRDNGYLIKSGENKNVPLQKAVDAGLFEIKQKPRYDHYGRMIINKTALITGKGQLHLVKRLTQEPETLE